jgi:cytoplasmic tRNA 2-thiolation protein 2
VALQFIHEMQSKAIQSWETSNSQALPVFGVGVAFVNESSVLSPKPKDEIDRAVQYVRSIVSSLLPGEKAVHIASLGDMFASGPEDGVGSLREVVGMIGDETGRDDFLQRSRMLLLQKVLLFGASARYFLHTVLLFACSELTPFIQYLSCLDRVVLIF